MLQVPELLNIPPKLFPVIEKFNDYSYFLLEGGRASGKTQSVARFLLYAAEARNVRICCGREIQNTVSDSVKTVFEDLIRQYNLNFEIKNYEITHNKTGSKIIFKGFREQGKVNIKGLEGVDILWIDEAQAITKPTLDVIIPTIRKKNSVAIFTMNRNTRFDAVYTFLANRDDCLHINVNYFDNPFVDEKIIKEAHIAKERNINDYKHIWLGLPLANNNEFLVQSETLDKAVNLVIKKEYFEHKAVMSVDLSASGADLCVAKLIKKVSQLQWEEAATQTWSEADTDITKGKIINLYSEWNPNMLIIDADGLGYPVWVSIKKVIEKCVGFRGAGKANRKNAINRRADGYLTVKEYLENGWLKLNCKDAIRQIEYIKKIYKPSGLIQIQDKKELRKEQGESPDFADSLMMGIYAINYHSNLFMSTDESRYENCTIKTDFDPFE